MVLYRFLTNPIYEGIFSVTDISTSVNRSLSAIAAAGGARAGGDNRRVSLKVGVVVTLIKGSVVELAPPSPRTKEEDQEEGEWGEVVGKKKGKKRK